MTLRTTLALCALALLPGCGKSSQTGDLGYIGPAWDGDEAYKTLRVGTSGAPPDFKAGLAAIRTALGPPILGRVDGARLKPLEDHGQLAARIKVTWSLVRLPDGRAFFRHIAAEAVEYAKGYECKTKGALPPAAGLTFHLWGPLTLEVECSRIAGKRSSVRAATVTFGDGKGGEGIVFKDWQDAQ